MGLIGYMVKFSSRINKFHRNAEFYVEAYTKKEALTLGLTKLNKSYGDTSSFYVSVTECD